MSIRCILYRIILIARRFHRSEGGAATTEYLLIMALIVLPLGLMLPMFLLMARTYGARLMSLVGLPFP
jgi:hypothetical protein